ncbi:hypothetical protein GL263_24980 [Streptomyces durbertensis]|uniref:Gram-positive cocci surface proteins LPxTG domain-containing protein n=1 Tax=Streptomyces durbertensis TaxID=2448886 RepID=A0ABR6EPE3_9ACTN|nr:hypothetical protein [Streptomyces durbertensis]MBB1246780.1 hypothetical protein [Streptomyces durbertensis]
MAATRRNPAGALVAAAVTVTLALAAPAAAAADGPKPPEQPSAAALADAGKAAGDQRTLGTLARFFAHDGRISAERAKPRVTGVAVPVHLLSADFVDGRPDAPVAELAYLAATAVAADGSRASVWSAEQDGVWRVVNIASGDDERRYAAAGEKRAPGGTVFREPQINAWYVLSGKRVLPLNEDAERAVGRTGTSLDAYRERVRAAYGGRQPGSRYDREGYAGGFAPPPAGPGEGGGPTAAQAGAVAAGSLGVLGALLLVRRRRHG